ncbi:MAG: hypothetical protein ABSB63_16585 [Spirochaetia bacterium]
MPPAFLPRVLSGLFTGRISRVPSHRSPFPRSTRKSAPAAAQLRQMRKMRRPVGRDFLFPNTRQEGSFSKTRTENFHLIREYPFGANAVRGTARAA